MLWKKGRRSDNVVDARGEDAGGGDRDFAHGTSAQRVRWFKTGFAQGQVSKCDTFATKSL